MRALKSIKGRDIGLDSDGTLVLPRGGGLALGEHGNQFEVPSPRRIVLFDDFVGDALQTALWFNPTKGTDAQTADFAQSTGFLSNIRGTTGDDAAGSMAVNGIQISGLLRWRADKTAHPRRMVFQTKLGGSAWANVVVFAGFTDQTAALEMPVESAGAGDTVTTNASDAVGFMIDTRMATDNVWLVGVKGNVDATPQNSGVTIASLIGSANTVLRVEVDQNEVATFFINGRQVGVTMPGAVTKTVRLAPVIAAFSPAAASNDVDVDYIYVAGDRE